MPATTCMGVSNIERVLFKELFPGDYQKFQATSNIAQTGGGARDLRFSGVNQLQPVILDMFPVIVPSKRKRAANPNVDLQQGALRWQGGSMDVLFEPAQDQRDNEWRFAQVANMPPLAGRVQPATYNASNREMILLMQDANHDVWPVIDVKSNVVLDAAIGAFVQAAFASHTHPRHAVVGYFDFINNTNWSK